MPFPWNWLYAALIAAVVCLSTAGPTDDAMQTVADDLADARLAMKE